MKRARCGRFAGSSGFSLVESVIVVVLLAIAGVTIVSLLANIFFGQSANKNLQVGVQLQQECAEQILAIRRRAGYTSVNNTSNALCSGLETYSNYGFGAPNVTLTDSNGGTVAFCPNTSSTCTAVISISLSPAGGTLPPVTLQLTKY